MATIKWHIQYVIGDMLEDQLLFVLPQLLGMTERAFTLKCNLQSLSFQTLSLAGIFDSSTQFYI